MRTLTKSKAEKETRIKLTIESKINEVWEDYNITGPEFRYQLKRARADKARAGKFKKLYPDEELKDIHLMAYTHYPNEKESILTIISLYTAFNLSVYQLAAAFLFNDASVNWTNEEFKNNVLSIN